MKNELKVFNDKQFGEMKIVIIDNKEWFVASEIAEKLGYKDKTMLYKRLSKNHQMDINPQSVEYQGLRQNEVTLCDNKNTFKMKLINEAGLYNAIFGSKLESAIKFQDWVFEEVLPSIRNTGGYVSNDDMFLDTYLPFADETTRMLFKNTLETVRNQNEIISKQKRVIERQEFEIEHKEDVIIGLCKDISLKDKRQRISDIVRFNAKGRYAERYALLYKEFDNKFHVDSKRRLNNAKERNEVRKNMNRMEYICEESGLNMTNELYEITCKLFENDFNELLKVWENTIV